MPTPIGKAQLPACPAVQPYHTGSNLPVAHQSNPLSMQEKTAVTDVQRKIVYEGGEELVALRDQKERQRKALTSKPSYNSGPSPMLRRYISITSSRRSRISGSSNRTWNWRRKLTPLPPRRPRPALGLA